MTIQEHLHQRLLFETSGSDVVSEEFEKRARAMHGDVQARYDYDKPGGPPKAKHNYKVRRSQIESAKRSIRR